MESRKTISFVKLVRRARRSYNFSEKRRAGREDAQKKGREGSRSNFLRVEVSFFFGARGAVLPETFFFAPASNCKKHPRLFPRLCSLLFAFCYDERCVYWRAIATDRAHLAREDPAAADAGNCEPPLGGGAGTSWPFRSEESTPLSRVEACHSAAPIARF